MNEIYENGTLTTNGSHATESNRLPLTKPGKPAKKSATAKEKDDGPITITAPNFQVVRVRITGTAPLCQHKFSEKAAKVIEESHREGKSGKAKKKDRAARDFEAEGRAAAHTSTEGWYGVPATAFRHAMVDACRMADIAMTVAKQAVFVLPDGFGNDGTPLVRLDVGEPEYPIMPVRLESGVMSLCCRPFWKAWAAVVSVEFDADFISPQSVVNLLARAGYGVGIGEGRPFSKKSVGMGWGQFKVEMGDTE